MTTAWIFPGQGSQFVGMGQDLYDLPAARAVFDEADQVLGFALSELCFSGPEAALTATEAAQPALLTVSVAVLRVLRERYGPGWSLPIAVAGHSLGEYSAVVAAGGLDFATALRLVRRRGELMAAARDGSMAAVIGMDAAALEAICHEVSADPGLGVVVVANYNSAEQLVLSGSPAAVAQAGALARERGAKRVLPLKVSAAFHSPLMAAAAQGMAEAFDGAVFSDLRLPLIANVTAEPLTAAAAVRAELTAQVQGAVRWTATIERMQALGVRTYIEIGAGKVLTGLVKRIAGDAQLITIGTAAEIAAWQSGSAD
jgi:[acyl-carrier-protein] S-malonyltransferase